MSTTTLQYATSKDGTTIAYDRLGDGPPVVLVSGGSVDRSSNAGLAEQLADDYTVFNYDRRGRGPSGDTQPYAVEREIEDIDAVIEAAGGKAHLYGSSSGAALALLAAAAGSPVTKLALWEPPYIVDESRPEARPEHGPDLPRPRRAGSPRRRRRILHGEGRRDARGVRGLGAGASRGGSGRRRSPTRSPTTPRSWATTRCRSTRSGRVTVPTLVLVGAASFGFFGPTAEAIAEVGAGRQVKTLEGQEHNVDPTVLGPALAEFFGR